MKEINENALHAIQFNMRLIHDVSEPDSAISLLGRQMACRFWLPPSAGSPLIWAVRCLNKPISGPSFGGTRKKNSGLHRGWGPGFYPRNRIGRDPGNWGPWDFLYKALGRQRVV